MTRAQLFEKPHEVLVRKEAQTDPELGEQPEQRTVETILNYGVVNINKPRGPTSHQVSDYVQKILGISKSGHSGTLDPKVTGVLPIALGRATRMVQALLPAGKEYVALMHLHKQVEKRVLKKALDAFTGQIIQLPPVKSAVKRERRKRTVYYLDILEIQGQDVLFRVGCEAGTYIRKLCHDIGQKIGVGAHMSELVRTKAGPFDVTTMVTLDDLRDAFYYLKEEKNEKYLKHVIQPVESCVEHLPKIWVFDSTVEALCHGTDLAVPGISKLHKELKQGQQVAVMTLKDELIALGTAKKDSENMLADKGIAVKIHKVFMLPGTYQKIKQ